MPVSSFVEMTVEREGQVLVAESGDSHVGSGLLCEALKQVRSDGRGLH